MAEREISKIVIRYRDGRAVRCALTGEFNPASDSIQIMVDDRPGCSAALDDIKAVFFLKDPRRRSAEIELDLGGGDAPTGAKARVEFSDGEIVHGRVGRYSVADKGFFLYPTAVDSNNEKIFVVASALRTLSIEG